MVKIKSLINKLLIQPSETNEETAGSSRFRQTVSEAETAPTVKEARRIYLNAAKDRAGETAMALAIPLSGGVAGPVVADATNTAFAIDGLYNLASKNGMQKTYRLAKKGDWAGATKSVVGDALNIAMTVPAVRLLGRVEKGLAVGNSLKGSYTLDLIGRELNNGIRTTPIIINPVQQNILAGKLGWAPRQTKVLWHNSDTPITKLKTSFPAWDVVKRDAPLGHVWTTGTETKQGFIGARPFHNRSTEKVILSKPMIQLNESIGNGKNTVRNEILRFVDQSGADAVNFSNIRDNTLQNQDVYAVFKDIDIIPRLTPAEMLGVPKSLRSNPKALEDPQYWGYQQWNQRYNAAVESGNLEEAQRLRDLHFNSHAKNNVIVDDLGMPKKVYHGSPEEFNVFDYTKSAKYPDGHFFFGEDFDYVKSHVKRRTSENPNIKSYYLYDTEKYPINKNKIDKRIVPHITDKNEFPLKNELSSDMASYIMTHFQDKPHIIYGYDVGREAMSGKYDYAVPFNTQIKLTNPITYDDGKIIPIVKRDNFRNPDIRYKQGGILKAQSGDKINTNFEYYLNTLPKNQRDSTDYNVRRYWELNGKPKDFEEAKKKGMFTLEDDGYWHANSIAYNKDTGEYEFMKSPNHPTIQLELDAYNKNKKFKKNYQLDSTSIPWKYVPIVKHQVGGIVYNPYISENQPIQFIEEIPEPYVPQYVFSSEPVQEKVVIAPLPEEQSTEEIIVEEPKQVVVEQTITPKSTSKRYDDKQQFISEMTDAYIKVLSEKGINPEYAKYLAVQDALESNFGKSYAGNWNFGNIIVGSSGASYTEGGDKDANGKPITQKFRNFDSLDDFIRYKVALLSNKRYHAFDGDIEQVYDRIKAGGYATAKNYVNSLKKLYEQYK